MDTSGRRNRGVLTGDDMAKWQATIEAPISYDYGRYTVLKASTWTQGLVVLQQLALAKGFDFDSFHPTSPDFIHYQVECAKLAFADRDTFYGDPKFVAGHVPLILDGIGLMGTNDHTPEETADLDTFRSQSKRAAVFLLRLSESLRK
jgi:gamma-glutamyltranspeptidase/glutathione hydrolase